MTTSTMPALTRDDVKALRNADEAVVFFFERGKTYVRAAKKVNPDDGFGDRTLDRIIELPQARITMHRGMPDWSGDPYDTKPARFAVASMSSPQYNPAWQTVAKLLREGDVLQVVFEANNNNQYVHDAGLSHDTFTLVVIREKANGNREEMHFPLEDRIAPRHSSARMIRSTE